MPATDLVHDPEERRLPLNPLRFLLGRFSGEDGFEEWLDVDWGDGGFEPYSIIFMRRVESTA